jgi:general secretion pathway protein A
MYLRHYELDKYPFKTNPDPSFLWLGEKHKEALAAFEYGILKRDGFLLLTGDVGTGKTSLVRYLMNHIDIQALIASISDPDLPPIDFFKIIAEEFNMGRDFASKADFLIHFKKFLVQGDSEDRSAFIIIDESQRLSHELLEQIRLLSNIELDDRKLLNIFFIGQSEFKEMLMDKSNEAISQRVTISYHIDPLNESETIRYIAHRLKVAGSKRGIFTIQACKEIFSLSDGVPRLINSVCDCALLGGYVKNRKVVDSSLVKECLIDLSIPIGSRAFR